MVAPEYSGADKIYHICQLPTVNCQLSHNFAVMLRVGKNILLLLLLNFLVLKGFSQSCSTLGQNPSTAFPVCGTNVFTQTSVPVCGGKTVPTKCTDGTVYTDINPYWYKFTCYTTGTLGFVITPKNSGDDYDWQLFDITGKDPASVYNDPSLIVSANWSGSPGTTGASPAGRNAFECSSAPAQGVSTFSTMPTIIAGHDYILLISHYDGSSQSGYTLSYPTDASGGTASIVNPVSPEVLSAYAVCDGTEIVLKLNRRVNCASIATDGSDFTVTGPVAISVTSVSGNGCNNNFDSDSLILKLNRILSPGSYTVNAKTGSDGNTLTDNCANSLATGPVASLRFLGTLPTPMDSIKPVICVKDTLELVFSKPILCGSIAADGSDFTITGPSPVSIKSASGICVNGVSTIVRIILTSAIRTNGNFLITLKNGNDGNPLIDECDRLVVAGSTLQFTTKDITAGDFNLALAQGCKKDSLLATHNGNNNASQWVWILDTTQIATSRIASYSSAAFGTHILYLTVSNGKCSDTSSKTFDFIDQTVKASFAVSADTACATDTLHFSDQSTGNPVAWKWDWGAGSTVTQQDPGVVTLGAPANRSGDRIISLMVTNNYNCTDIATHVVYVLMNCNIAVPSAFTPNGDGLNDYLYPLNAYKAGNLVFRVFHRSGQIIFETRNPSKKWDGRVNGMLQPSGTYVWTLDYTDITTKKKVSQSGTTVLIR